MLDFVITWVNEKDPDWRKERDYYYSLEKEDDDNTHSRFRDWDNLRYWFRGVENFAPWVNKVFFITCGHLPEWLNKDNPKLQIVKHSDYIPAEYLPTYNSFVIEYFFHRIKGLSDTFVYFNDDMFLIDKVEPRRFLKNGLPCDIGGMTFNLHSGMFGASVLLAKTLINDHFKKSEVICKKPSNWFNTSYMKASLINLMCLFVRKEEFIGFVNPHLPQAYQKKAYEEVWNNCRKDIIRTCTNRFRDYSDVCHWIVRYWQLASNSFSPINPYKDGRYYLINDNNVNEIADSIRRQKKKMICINDSEDISNFEEAKNIINKSFNMILPEKSSFEL